MQQPLLPDSEILSQKALVQALKSAVLQTTPEMYAQAVETLYEGLWNRTTAQLRGELETQLEENPRERFGNYARIYTQLAEYVAAELIGNAQEVSTTTAMEIVWTVAKHISAQARSTSQLLGYDLVTERPLLPGALT